MAQRSIILGFEPRLKGNFVAIFEVIKALQFRCFFTLYIYSPHYQKINVSDFAIEFIRFVRQIILGFEPRLKGNFVLFNFDVFSHFTFILQIIKK